MPTRSRQTTLLLAAAFATVYVVWGSTYWAIRVGLDSFPPFALGAIRYLIAGGLMLVGVLVWSGARPTRSHWLAAAITGTLLLVGGNGAVIVAEQRAPTGLVALIVASAPLWFVLLDWWRPGGRRPDRMVFAGLAAGTLGIVLLVDPGTVGTGVPVRETLLLVGGALAWAAGSIWSKHTTVGGSAALLVALQMLVAGVVFTGLSLATGEIARLQPASVTADSVLALGYLIIFGSIVGFTAYVWLVRMVSPAAASTYAYVNPVVALAIGTMVGGEQLTSRTLLAAAVLLGAVVLITAGPTLRQVVAGRIGGSAQRVVTEA
jgi:drug/metabolite transporter (DMT)-like permease